MGGGGGVGGGCCVQEGVFGCYASLWERARVSLVGLIGRGGAERRGTRTVLGCAFNNIEDCVSHSWAVSRCGILFFLCA